MLARPRLRGASAQGGAARPACREAAARAAEGCMALPTAHHCLTCTPLYCTACHRRCTARSACVGNAVHTAAKHPPCIPARPTLSCMPGLTPVPFGLW